jgi:transposase-like protein
MKNRHYTEEEMVSFYADWQQSKLCKAAYCQQVGLAKSTFSYWIKKLKLRERQATSSPVPATPYVPGFIELDVSGKREQAYPVIEIEYPSGVRLRCYIQAEASWLKALL